MGRPRSSAARLNTSCGGKKRGSLMNKLRGKKKRGDYVCVGVRGNCLDKTKGNMCKGAVTQALFPSIVSVNFLKIDNFWSAPRHTHTHTHTHSRSSTLFPSIVNKYGFDTVASSFFSALNYFSCPPMMILCAHGVQELKNGLKSKSSEQSSHARHCRLLWNHKLNVISCAIIQMNISNHLINLNYL